MGIRYDVRGFVYFIECPANGLIKIGVTASHPDGRLESLRRGSPFPLEPLGFIRGGREVEKALHIRFGRQRTHGEWFQPDEALMRFVRAFLRPWPTRGGPDYEAPGPDHWQAWLEEELRKLGEFARTNWKIERHLYHERFESLGVIGLA